MQFIYPTMRLVRLDEDILTYSHVDNHSGNDDSQKMEAPARHVAPTSVNSVLSGVADQK